MMRNLYYYNVIKLCFLLTIIFLFFAINQIHTTYDTRLWWDKDYNRLKRLQEEPENIVDGNWRQLTPPQIYQLSELGRYLFLSEKPTVIDKKKNYNILIWKYGQTIIRRHIRRFTNTDFDPFEDCSVKNCRITYDDKDIKTADAVLFHMQRMKGISDLPPAGNRSLEQVWVFLTDETPLHTFFDGNVKLKDFDGVFNWSMTYRMDSDVPVPYGRTVQRSRIGPVELNMSKKQDVLVAVMGSNCGGYNHRWSYIAELQKYIPVDIYGGCGPLKCKGHFDSDCALLNQYKFYLAFENSNCEEYLTEKVWWNAFAKEAIPIVMGGTKSNYKQLLPPNSFIHVEDFAGPSHLASYIKYVNKSRSDYLNFFKWRSKFEIRNEHGYFKSRSYHYCRLCEGLNYNIRRNFSYPSLENFWSKKDCRPAWDQQT